METNPFWNWRLKWSEVAQSCPTLCNPMDSSLPGSAVHGIFQARILEWIAISFSRGSSQPRDRIRVSCIADRCFTIWTTREAPIEDLTVLKTIKTMMVRPLTTNFKTTVRADWAVSSLSPPPSIYKSSCPQIVRGQLVSGQASAPPPTSNIAGVENKANFSFSLTWLLYWLLCGEQRDPVFSNRFWHSANI